MQPRRPSWLPSSTRIQRLSKPLAAKQDIFGDLALENFLPGGAVAHLEFSARDSRGGDDFKIGDRDEVRSPARGQTMAIGRRLSTRPTPITPFRHVPDHGRGTSEGQIVDLIGLTASDSDVGKAGHTRSSVWPARRRRGWSAYPAR